MCIPFGVGSCVTSRPFFAPSAGCQRATVVSYLAVGRRFLHERFGRKALRLEQLRAQDLHRFVGSRDPTCQSHARQDRHHGAAVGLALLAAARRRSDGPRPHATRRGDLETVASPAVDAPEQVERLLACCDRSSPSGKRDYAILLLLARLGLRGGEVVNMALEDLDWERGELVVRGKGQRLERLPLPADIGAAVARYLCEVRPPCATRRLFVRMMAPYQDLAERSAVCCVVRRAVAARRIGSGAQGSAPAEALPRHQPAAPRRVPERDRSAAAPPPADHHADLCQGGHRGATRHCTAVAGECVMSSLQVALDEYLAVRHALGYKLRLSGRLLQRFVDFADRQGATYITSELASAWAMLPGSAQPAQWANRLGMVRRFALYCSAQEPRTVVPPPDLLPHRYRRPDPYLYSDEQIRRLLDAAQRLPSATGLRPQTFATLFGLYVATGLRANEPLRLDRDDVDLTNGVLTIRGTKFGKSRYVPVHRLHPARAAALRRIAGPLLPTRRHRATSSRTEGLVVDDNYLGRRVASRRNVTRAMLSFLRVFDFSVVEGCGHVGEGCGGGQRIALSTAAPGAPQAHRPHVHSLPGAQRTAPAPPTFRGGFMFPQAGA